ncbi:MAG: DOMON domain-containing protein [Cyclobacteriaceae bacterium]
MKKLMLLVTSCIAYSAQAQMELSVSGMSWKCNRDGDSLVMELRAPSQGWVGVGFNQDNNIVRSDLLLFHVVDGQEESTDLYVQGIGNPKTDESLGGSHDIEVLDFSETNRGTYIKFRRLWKGKDVYDYRLKNGEAFWLILAYSTHDEFEHHSRMRQHEKVVFNVE